MPFESMSEPREIIVVCTGNTCRSPMGARLLAHALAAEAPPLNEITVTSAGISAFGGDEAARHSVKALKKVGLDLADHRSRRLTAEMVEQALVIVVMTEAHRNYLRTLYPALKTPVILFREHVGKDSDPQVPDPYGSTLDAYEETRDALAEAIPSLLGYLRQAVLSQES